MKYGDATLGQVEAVWNRLGGYVGVQQFLAGLSEVVMKAHIIDCDADPIIHHKILAVAEHQKMGFLAFDPSHVELWLAEEQERGDRIVGNDLHAHIPNGKRVLNANVLDYLLIHQELIPRNWKKRARSSFRNYIFFWGTIYRVESGAQCVRCLYWDGDGWYPGLNWLSDLFLNNAPAALLAS